MPDAELTMGAVGFFGKLPARGDFLRRGLPRGFAEAWDDCMSRGIVGSRALLGARWLDAWLEAPIWRFALPAGMCGEEAVLGVWMPSTDAGGRYFPLTLAALSPEWGRAASWLADAEAAGLAALQDDLGPDELMDRLGHPQETVAPVPDLAAIRDGYALWWTDGSPFVPAGCRIEASLPDGAMFAAMIDQRGDAMPAETTDSEKPGEP